MSFDAAMETVNAAVKYTGDILWGWPLIIGVLFTGVVATIALRGIQFSKFFTAWKYVFSRQSTATTQQNAISPLQAFINALSASIGNGALVGMAMAVFLGGPGAAFWILVFGLLYLPIRFCEVCASSMYTEKGAALGGPMIYLKKLPGGSVLTIIYTLCVLFYTFVAGATMQCNSIALGVKQLSGGAIPALVIGAALFLFFGYVALGGSKRIMKAAEAIIPFKVGLFFIALLGVLIYNWASIIPALVLIFKSGMSLRACSGAMIGITIQTMMRQGMVKSINATEAGVGTAGILFGSVEGVNPVRNGIMAMVSTFISNYLVCFVMVLALITTGVWNNGLQSTPLVVSMFATTFGGTLSCWIASLLTISFGLGVAVAYSFIGKQSWQYLTKTPNSKVFTFLFCLSAGLGGLGLRVDLIWYLVDIAVALLLIFNLIGLLYLMPQIRKAVLEYKE